VHPAGRSPKHHNRAIVAPRFLHQNLPDKRHLRKWILDEFARAGALTAWPARACVAQKSLKFFSAPADKVFNLSFQTVCQFDAGMRSLRSRCNRYKWTLRFGRTFRPRPRALRLLRTFFTKSSGHRRSAFTTVELARVKKRHEHRQA
jgi:hypothetical protein